MDTYEVLSTRRSIREFQDKVVSYELLEKCVNAARLAPQAGNKQPLEFIIVDDPGVIEEIFDNISLANAIGWEPSKDKMARAYVVICANTKLQGPSWLNFDVAFAASNICMTAWNEGVASCIVGAFNRQKVSEMLNVPEDFKAPLMIALGYPAHESKTETLIGDSIDYWRDADGTFHVPKRTLSTVLHHNKFSHEG